jgi:hypothetical protein
MPPGNEEMMRKISFEWWKYYGDMPVSVSKQANSLVFYIHRRVLRVWWKR